MLDFFRDSLLELQGIDSEKAKMERLMKKQQRNEKKDKILIPLSIKKMIQALSAFYMVSCVSSMIILLQNGLNLLLIKFILQILISSSLFVLMFFKTKKAEIISIVLIILFIVLQYSGTFLFMNVK